jgi:1-acyl-sn-glycerol-3-phosphate acyltransferase
LTATKGKARLPGQPKKIFSVVWLRSSLYFVWFLAISVAMHLAALPLLLLPRKAMVWMAQSWSALNLWGLKVFAGLDYEVRGEIPSDGALIAAKHMSMWDTLALYALLHDPVVVLKYELKSIPFYGWCATKADMIFVDRRKHGTALRRMADEATKRIRQGRSLIIFPEGSRRTPGDPPDYKPGVAGIYGQLQTPCVPVALNSGLFWTGPNGFLKRPGRIVVEFLPAIPAGLKRADFMRVLEDRIETCTAKLICEGRQGLSAQALGEKHS